MAIGERIHHFRLLHGFTQKYLGQQLGFSDMQADVRIAQYEKGARSPKEKYLNALADIFVCAAEKVLRELAFITALPASAVLTAQGASAQEAAAVQDEQVLVQGIADLVLVFPDHLELLDYKTDRRKTEADFLRAYRPQLNLYALAIDKRFAPKKVTYKGIYSLELGRLIEA